LIFNRAKESPLKSMKLGYWKLDSRETSWLPWHKLQMEISSHRKKYWKFNGDWLTNQFTLFGTLPGLFSKAVLTSVLYMQDMIRSFHIQHTITVSYSCHWLHTFTDSTRWLQWSRNRHSKRSWNSRENYAANSASDLSVSTHCPLLSMIGIFPMGTPHLSITLWPPGWSRVYFTFTNICAQ
jgi:hypothetical protein